MTGRAVLTRRETGKRPTDLLVLVCRRAKFYWGTENDSSCVGCCDGADRNATVWKPTLQQYEAWWFFETKLHLKAQTM